MHHLWNAAETILASASTDPAANSTTTNNPPNTPGMGDMLSIVLLVMLFGSGLYALYTGIRLHKTCMLFPNKFLYPGGCTADNCADEDGFINYIIPRLLLLGAAMLVCGGGYLFYMLNFHAAGTSWVDIAIIIVPAGVFVWYMFVQRKASKEFW